MKTRKVELHFDGEPMLGLKTLDTRYEPEQVLQALRGRARGAYREDVYLDGKLIVVEASAEHGFGPNWRGVITKMKHLVMVKEGI